MRRRFAGVALVAVLASGCASGSTPQQVLAERVDAATEAANARDADGLRDAALELADAISAQRDAGELPADRAQRLLALATTLRERADVIDPDVQARIEAEQDAERAREEAAAERAAREQAEREAAEREAAQQAERDAAAERERAAEAERAAQERARAQRPGKGSKDADKATEDADKAAEDAEKAAEDAEKAADERRDQAEDSEDSEED